MALPVSVRNIFAKRFSEVREASGIKQEKLAELLGMNERSIRHYESGKAFPRAEILDKLCEIFEMEPSEWFPREGSLDQKKALALIRQGLDFLEATHSEPEQPAETAGPSPASPQYGEEGRKYSDDRSVGFGRGTRKLPKDGSEPASDTGG